MEYKVSRNVFDIEKAFPRGSRPTMPHLPPFYRVERSFLWKVHQQGCLCAYLFGTAHEEICASELRDEVWEALASSDTCLFEADVAASPEIPPLKTKGLYNEGEGLRQRLTEEEWTILKKRLPAIPADKLDLLRPMLVYNVYKTVKRGFYQIQNME